MGLAKMIAKDIEKPSDEPPAGRNTTEPIRKRHR